MAAICVVKPFKERGLVGPNNVKCIISLASTGSDRGGVGPRAQTANKPYPLPVALNVEVAAS